MDVNVDDLNVLFVAPASKPALSSKAELMDIASGFKVEVAGPLLDRPGLQRALEADTYDILHFVGHGDLNLFGLSKVDDEENPLDSALDSADLASMLTRQEDVRFVFVNACNSYAMGTAIHNALHVPVVCMNLAIRDRAARRFAETFYRSYKAKRDIKIAFDAARETLLRTAPSQADIPLLINGDMSTHTEMTDCMMYVKGELAGVRLSLADIDGKVDTMSKRMDGLSGMSVRVLLVLAVLMIVSQLATPFIQMIVHTLP